MSRIDADLSYMKCFLAGLGRFGNLEAIEPNPGPVWRAWDRSRRQPVQLVRLLPLTPTRAYALRSLQGELAVLAGGSIEQALEVIRMDDDGRLIVFEDRPWISLEDRVLRRGALPPLEALELIRRAAEAYQRLERQGFQPRRHNPDTLLLDEEAGLEEMRIASPLRDLYSYMPRDCYSTCGRVIGKPQFVAPESVRGHEADRRTNIYHLGAWLYFALFGRAPFTGNSLPSLFLNILREPVAIPPEQELSDGLADLIIRALEKDPASRFQSFGELIGAIRSFTSIDDPKLLRGLASSLGCELRELRPLGLNCHTPSFAARAEGQAVRVTLGLSSAGRSRVQRRFEDSRREGEIAPPYPILAGGRLSGGVAYLIERDLSWPTLQSRLDSRGAIDGHRLAAIAALALVSLADLHSRGWIHGNISPRTILRGPDGAVFLDEPRYDSDRQLPEDRQVFRRSSSPYLAPELKKRGRPSVKSDLFALGASLRAALPDDARGPLRALLDRLAHPRAWRRPGSAISALRQAKSLTMRRPA